MIKKSNKKNTNKTEKAKKGMRYICDECGMAVTVDEVCSCSDACDITCCGQNMRLLDSCGVC